MAGAVDTASSLGTWAKANPDQVMQLAGRAAPLVGARPLAGSLRTLGGLTEMGMYPGRQQEYTAQTAKNEEIKSGKISKEGLH